MRKFHFQLIYPLLISFLLISSINAQAPLSRRIANYDIKVNLDTDNKIITGKQVLTWTNSTSSSTDELQFHLYLNAFKNTKTTFMQESGKRHRGLSVDLDDSSSFGWTEITSLKLGDGTDLTDMIEFIQPDDDNLDDQTVVRLPLRKRVRPGKTIVIEIDFEAKLPKIMARTGYSRDFYLVGQWFPKIGVFEDAGQRGRESAGWNCHQFHSNSEFYSDFGIYNVEITLPQEFVVGATGILQEENRTENGTKTLKYSAEDVVDFAWTASPLFEVVTDKWQDVDITLLIQPQHASQADRHIQPAKNAFEYFEKYAGKFPYPSLTIVDPPLHALASGGMEYPMFITAGCLWGMPDGIRFTEAVTIHELGHNYFMGILASNEFEEAWLDEGFTTYFENRIMDHYYGEKHSMFDLLGYHVGDSELSRMGYVKMHNPHTAVLNRWSWKYPDGGYGMSSYNKPAVVLSTLEKLIGEESMTEITRTYYDRWKFRHPSSQDFIDIVNEVVRDDSNFQYGSDMNWYFDQTIKTGEICDYKVSRISSVKKENHWGIFGDREDKTFLADTTSMGNYYKYKTKTVLIRIGEIKIPQEVLIHFTSGEEILEIWDGQSRTKTFSYERDDKIEWVQIDPDRKVLLDMRLHNNSLTINKTTGTAWKYAAKVLFWVQSTMVSLFY